MAKSKREPVKVKMNSTGQIFRFRYVYYSEERNCNLVVVDAGPENLGTNDEFPLNYFTPIYK